MSISLHSLWFLQIKSIKSTVCTPFWANTHTSQCSLELLKVHSCWQLLSRTHHRREATLWEVAPLRQGTWSSANLQGPCWIEINPDPSTTPSQSPGKFYVCTDGATHPHPEAMMRGSIQTSWVHRHLISLLWSNLCTGTTLCVKCHDVSDPVCSKQMGYFAGEQLSIASLKKNTHGILISRGLNRVG